MELKCWGGRPGFITVNGTWFNSSHVFFCKNLDHAAYDLSYAKQGCLNLVPAPVPIRLSCGLREARFVQLRKNWLIMCFRTWMLRSNSLIHGTLQFLVLLFTLCIRKTALTALRRISRSPWIRTVGIHSPTSSMLMLLWVLGIRIRIRYWDTQPTRPKSLRSVCQNWRRKYHLIPSQELYIFMQNFLARYPKYKEQDFYILGESVLSILCLPPLIKYFSP